MRRFLCVFTMIALLFSFIGCGDPEKVEAVNNNKVEEAAHIRTANDPSIRLWTDAETGVQYIIYHNTTGYGGMGGITPRLNIDGTLYRSEGVMT